MRRILLMVRKDLLRQRRAPMAMLFVLAFPLVFAGLLALTFGGGSPEVPTVTLLVEDRDPSPFSSHLVQSMTENMPDFIELQRVGDEGRTMMERGEAAALLIVPQGLGDSLLRGEPATLELVRNPAQGILPDIAEQALVVMAEHVSAAFRVRPGRREGSAAMPSTAGPPLPQLMTLNTIQLGQEETEDSGGGTRGLVFLIVLPGISVWALFMLGDMGMRDILTESTGGTLRRQLVGPIKPGEIVLAKALYTATLALVSLVLLAAIGRIASGRPVDLPGFTVLSLCLVLAVTGFASVLYGLARTERQGSTIGSVLLLLFAFMGGSFIQIDSLPGSMRQLAPISPFYWGTMGYRELIRDAGGLVDILPYAGVLFAIGAIGLLVGSKLLGRRVATGGAV